MNNHVDFRYLLQDSRARVYLLWAAITGVGYVATHFYQNKNINIVWFCLAAAGFWYMYKVMPLKVKQMRNIFLAWLVPISIGIGVSSVAVRTNLIPELVGYLGVFWLAVSAVGYCCNGVVDPPSRWYFIAAAINIIAALFIYSYEPLLVGQYLIAAIVSVWSMLMLWLFRSDAW